MGRSFNPKNVPPYHKIVYHCHECGMKYEDPTIYKFVDSGYSYLLDNLEPNDKLNYWDCPNHPNKMVHIGTYSVSK
jgi:hypothetical protein